MKLRKEDQEWLNGEILRLVRAENLTMADSLKPHGVRRVTFWLKEWGAISALWAIPLGLLGVIVTLGIFTTNGITKNATFQATTDGRLTAIENSVKDLHVQQVSQDLTNHAALPLDQFGRSLTSLSASIAIARSQRIAIPSNVIDDLQNKLMATNKSASNYWPSAVQFVDYKFQIASAVALPNCLDTLSADMGNEIDNVYTDKGVGSFPQFSGPQAPHWMAHVVLGHCNLDLDDTADFAATSVGKFFKRVKDMHPQADRFFIVLNDSHVTYSGGKMLPISGLDFQNCTFEFTPPTGDPTEPFKAMTTQLLAANHSKGVVSIPSGI